MTDETAGEKKIKYTKHLLRQYQLLLARWYNTAAEVSLSEIADVLDCTPRHTRVLLTTMMALKWLTWAGGTGRGAKGRLHCRVRDITSHSEETIAPISLASPAFDVAENQQDLSTGRKCVCLNFYRPIDKIIPSDHSGRVERHLMKMVHAGLTRFNDEGVPVPDLAATMDVCDNARRWVFTLRKELFWHNGESVHAEQLLRSLRNHFDRPAFAHIASSVVNEDSIVLTLSRPDAMLAHRLANPVHALSHPDGEEIGLGPFALREHDNHHLRLIAFSRYHGVIPAITDVEYRIRPYLPRNKWTTLTLFRPGEESEEAEQAYSPAGPSGLIFMAFNARKGRLDADQQTFIRALAGIAIKSMQSLDNIQPVLPAFAIAEDPLMDCVVKLPPTLTLKYFWCSETEMLMNNLKRQLLYWGCHLEIKPVDANLWFSPICWEGCDIGVSDLRFGEQWYFAPAERFRHSVMIKSLMLEKTWNRFQKLEWKLSADSRNYPAKMVRVMRMLTASKAFYPLYSLRFQVKATKGITGVRVSSQGWPDFTRLDIAGQ